MTRLFAVLLTLFATTMLVACGNDGNDTSEPSIVTDAVATVPEDDSSDDASGDGDASAPDLGDVDVPLPDWADAVAVDDSGPLALVQFTVPVDQQDATVAFYDDWTESQAEEYVRTEGESGGVSYQTDTVPGEKKTIISILAPLEGDDFVAVTVSQGIFE